MLGAREDLHWRDDLRIHGGYSYSEFNSWEIHDKSGERSSCRCDIRNSYWRTLRWYDIKEYKVTCIAVSLAYVRFGLVRNGRCITW